MTDTHRLLISFEPTFGNADMVRAAIKGICTDFFKLADSAPSIMDFCLIVTELMNNAVEHSKTELIDVELVLSGDEAVFRLISAGTGFDPTAAAALPGPELDREHPEGGYGLALIHAIADGMEYECRENRNTVTLRKTFPKISGEER